MRARLFLALVMGITFLALSVYLYLLYQALEFYWLGFSSIAAFTLGSLLILRNIKFLEPIRRIIPFMVVGATVSFALLTFRLDSQIAESYYGTMLSYASSRLSWLVLTVAGVHVQLSNDVLIFPKGVVLAITPICSGAYSSIAFLLLSVIMVADLGRKAPRARLLIALATGVLGVNLANVFRITFLASIMYLYGLSALEVVHQFAGYAIFLGFMGVFWLLSLRWLPARRHMGQT